MYSGQKNFSQEINTLKLIVESYAVNKKDEQTRKFLEKIITEAHKLVMEQIEENALSYETYKIITLMVDNDRPSIRAYLKNIDPNNISDEDYATLSAVLKSLITDLEKP